MSKSVASARLITQFRLLLLSILSILQMQKNGNWILHLRVFTLGIGRGASFNQQFFKS
jgi:hypothetical protein